MYHIAILVLQAILSSAVALVATGIGIHPLFACVIGGIVFVAIRLT